MHNNAECTGACVSVDMLTYIFAAKSQYKHNIKAECHQRDFLVKIALTQHTHTETHMSLVAQGDPAHKHPLIA